MQPAAEGLPILLLIEHGTNHNLNDEMQITKFLSDQQYS